MVRIDSWGRLRAGENGLRPTMGRTRSAALIIVLFGAMTVGCPHPRQESCTITSPAAGLPLLLRIGVKANASPPPAAPICNSQKEIRFQCEAVDDLSGLLGTGVACGPGGAAPQIVCPALKKRVTQLPQASVVPKPCGETACENVEIIVDQGADTSAHLVFYDDPSCHGGPPEPACQAAVHKCYYRLLSTSVELKGAVD